MKKIISLLLVMSIICGMFSVFAVGANAANPVNRAYVQQNTTAFVNYLKNNSLVDIKDGWKYYWQVEEAYYANETLAVYIDYYYHYKTHLIEIDAEIVDNTDTTVDNHLSLFIPDTYGIAITHEPGFYLPICP